MATIGDGRRRRRPAGRRHPGRVVYPGPIAVLIRREIGAYLEIGSRFGGHALVRSLAELVLATPEPDEGHVV